MLDALAIPAQSLVAGALGADDTERALLRRSHEQPLVAVVRGASGCTARGAQSCAAARVQR